MLRDRKIHFPMLCTVALSFLTVVMTATEPAMADDKASADVQASKTANAGGKQLENLAHAPTTPRFALGKRVWPDQFGLPHICLWHNDAYAAFSFTIDDNCAPDHAWWVEMGEKYGYRFTWFLITGRIKGGYWGTWEGYAQMRKLGHDFQSHTVTHLHTESPEWKGIVAEYVDSRKTIQTKIPNTRVLTLAYPGGKNQKLNSREEAAKVYIAARGTIGTPNATNQIDYFNVNASGGLHLRKDKTGIWGNIRNLFEPFDERYHERYDRGWGVFLAHGLNDELKQKLGEIFEYLKAHGDDAWVGLFREVALYGQERDTAKLKVTAVEDTKITFTLTDDMDDTVFDFPLTIKVRLSDAWSAVTATQDDNPIKARVIEHDGKKFALIQVIPDRGEVHLAAIGIST